MSTPFKQALRQHFQNVALTHEQIESLRALTVASRGVSEQKRAVALFWKVAITALIVACFFSGYWLSALRVRDYTVEMIAAEVALNHVKLRRLELETADISKVRGYFEQLDFLPIQSALDDFARLSLAGGRYCSLRGHIAAQLRYVDNRTGTPHTLYQTLYRRNAFPVLPVLEKSETPLTVYARGVAVRIWVEKGVLNALAKSP